MAPRLRNWSCESSSANSASMRCLNSVIGSLADALAMGRAAQAEIAQETIVFVALRIRCGEQFFAHENGICAGKKTQAHRLTAEGIASGAEANHRCGHEQARCGNHARQDESVHRLSIGERGALDSNKHIDGHTFGM